MHEIDESPRRADDDLDTCRECLDLGFIRTTAVDAEHSCSLARTGLLEVSGDLNAEFARRHHHERLRCGPGGVVALHPLEKGNAEAQGLAGAGLGLADEVAALEGQRKCHGLDREGALDAGGSQRGDDLGRCAQLRERRGEGRRIRGRFLRHG